MKNDTHLAVVRDDQAPEPSAPVLDIATIDAVARLMGQVERAARAQRPIVLHSAPAVVPQASPDPVDVRIPGPPAAPPTAPPTSNQRLYTRPEMAFGAGLASTLAGVVAVGVEGGTTAAGAAVAGILLTLGSGVAIVRRESQRR